ncbi:response regulator receiver domain protein [Bacteriovorax sp. BSW11_IV]|uniref:ATP-binding protein n=1 Tax=Bacteriovorax sp. BSW11_IV TaxID=1353529 RepID=UPI000389E2CD|nr:CHASE domain-containing protein [Bacteriovorax sp. BSW11_IV]EQC44974.1 response regulator receiver domain protein [Bacteriovorax sp. BSW11_IV]
MAEKSHTKNAFIKFVFLIVGLFLSAWFFKLTNEKQNLNARAGIRKQLEQSAAQINSELSVSTEVLYSLSNLLITFPDLNASQFDQFTRNLSTRKDSILMVEWQPRVLASERQAFIKDVISKGVKDFRLVEPDKNGKLIDAKKRPEHYPVLYGITTRGHKLSIGLDLAWSPERMQSKFESRDAGAPMASNTFPVMHSNTTENSAPGFAITLPVYKLGVIPKTLEQRKELLRGYLASVIYLDDFLSQLRKEIKRNQLEIEITDLATDERITKKILHKDDNLSEIKIIDVYGQKWKLEVFATDLFLASYVDIPQYFFPVALFIFTIVLFFFLWHNERQNNELLKTRSELQNALIKANVATDSKTIFLANMSHEIRTPMNAILGYANLIKNESREYTRLEYIERMEKSGKHLLKILEDILHVSSHEISKIQLKKDNFKLKELISDVTNIMMTKFTKSNVKFECSMIGEELNLYGDPLRLRQILINLLNNAYKFTNEGFIILTCESTKDERGQNLVTFTVKDSGIGIDEKFISHIFNPFSQENETYRRNQGGVGLGLSIVYNIVEMMGGKIEINSKKGEGTTFTLNIPFEDAKVKSVETRSTTEAKISLDNLLTGKKILAAEDDEDARFLIDHYLKDHQLEIDYAKNGIELLEKFKEKSYDLILTDIQMPELDGISALKTLREDGVTTPIVIMSAHALPEEHEQGIKAGANDFITKPINKKKLITAIRKYLEA